MSVVKLLYFARLKESLGTTGEELELPPEVMNVTGLIHWLAMRKGPWGDEFGGTRQIRAAINHELVTENATFKGGDEIAFFPPVTGG